MRREDREGSGLATTAMVLGVIAIVGSWIPFLNIVSIILGVLALIFGIIPLFQKRGIGKAVAGVVLGLLSIVIGFYMTSAAVTDIDKAVNGTDSPSAASGEKKDEAPAQTTFNAGEPIVFDGKTVTVSNVERNWSSGNEFSKPDTGNEFVKVQVEIKNDSKNQISYNTFDWKIRNSNGAITDVDMVGYGDGSLKSGELAPGGVVSGSLAFQAPDGDQGLVLQYEPSFWGSKKLEIKI